MTTAALSVRVPPELKRRMEAHSERNWSALIRQTIEQDLQQLERREAAEAMDALRARLPTGGPRAEELIRRMRDGRYGPEPE